MGKPPHSARTCHLPHSSTPARSIPHSSRPGLLAGQSQLMVAAGSGTSALGAPRCRYTHPPAGPPACSAIPARTSAAPRRAAACAAPSLRTAPHRLRSAMRRAVPCRTAVPRRSGGDKVCGGGAGGAGQGRPLSRSLARSLARCMPDVWMNCSRRQLRAGAGV